MLRTVAAHGAYPRRGRLGTVLIPKRFWAAIEAGEVQVAYRRWRRPTVKTAGTLRSPVGMLEIDEVAVIDEGDLTEGDARAAGYADLAELQASVARDDTDTELYRIRFHRGGPDPRDELASRAALDPEEVDALVTRLRRMDERSPVGAWTRATLEAIAREPGRRAGDLAEALGRERLAFKKDVRRLKALGLTESLQVGYRLSPRGRALLAALSPDP
jgi:hypothetical protein